MIGINNNNEEEESQFGINGTVRCYCGKKIKIEYNEITGLKDTRCKNCGYNHLDIIYAIRKQVEEAAKTTGKPFFMDIKKKRRWFSLP